MRVCGSRVINKHFVQFALYMYCMWVRFLNIICQSIQQTKHVHVYVFYRVMFGCLSFRN